MVRSWLKGTFLFLKFFFFSFLLLSVAVLMGKALGGLDAQTLPADGNVELSPCHTIVIDAGHGGRDGGACADDDGTREKDINLAVAKKLEALLKTTDLRVVMVREEDIELADPTSHHKKRDDLNARIAKTNACENPIFVSIHMNKFPVSRYSGLQVYYSNGASESRVLAEEIQQSAVRYLDPQNERKPKSADGTIYILSHLQVPAVIVECGFLSNYEEKELLKTESYQMKLAMSMYIAIVNYVEKANA